MKPTKSNKGDIDVYNVCKMKLMMIIINIKGD